MNEKKVTPVACFGSGHRKIYKQDLRKLDVKFRKLVRAIVGPPGGLDWSAPWHHIFHEWNARVLNVLNKLVSNYGPEDAWNNIGN